MIGGSIQQKNLVRNTQNGANYKKNAFNLNNLLQI